MAMLEAKGITELDENTVVSDNDLIPIGNNGTDTLRKITTKNFVGNYVQYVTQSEYDALPDSKLSNGVLYLISDAEE